VTLLLVYFQLPFLLESWHQIQVPHLAIILLVANFGTILCFDSDFNPISVMGTIALALLYFYLLTFWVVPMFLFQIAIMSLAFYLFEEISNSRYFEF
jgi:hypothetical protein